MIVEYRVSQLLPCLKSLATLHIGVEARYGVLEKYCFWPQKMLVLSILLVLNNWKKKRENKIDFRERGECNTSDI